MPDKDGYLIICNQLEKMGKYELKDIIKELYGIKKAILISALLTGKHSKSELEKKCDMVDELLDERARKGEGI